MFHVKFMETHGSSYSSTVREKKTLAEDKRKKRRDSLRIKKIVKRRDVFGVKYNIDTHVRVGSFVGPRTREGHVFVTSLVNDETTD